MANADQRPFRVVISGGGIAGLTLANALEQADIDYVLLESRPEIAPQLGASVGIFSHGCRILDQLGALKRVNEEMAYIRVLRSSDAKGRPISGPDNGDKLTKARTGYVVPWGDREILLRVLYENLQDRSKVLVNKKVVDVEHSSDGVKVSCQDGSAYEGDVLAGADGVFSKTREKLWQLAETEHPALVRADRNALTADYNVLFGISTLKSELVEGDMDTAYDSGRCMATIRGQGGKTYFFAEEKLDRTYTLTTIPRYDAGAAEDFVRRHGDLAVRPGITLAELWGTTTSRQLVSTEEGAFQLWTWGRIACLGDSIHKMTPNLGAGANSAIESAAALANELKSLVDKSQGAVPSGSEVQLALVRYQQRRELRAKCIVDASRICTRTHTLNGLAERLFVRFALPHSSDLISEMASDMVVGSAKIDYLPIPRVSLTGTRPFNPSFGVGMKESKLKRALLALPLLALVYVASATMDATISLPWAEEQVKNGTVVFDGNPIPLRLSFYHIKGLDYLASLLNSYFLPAIYDHDSVSRRQLMSFLSDGVVMLNVWMFESGRRANAITILQFPVIFTFLGQGIGMGVVAPLYYFLHYVLSPIEKFSSTDHRLTRLNYSIAVLPAVLGAFFLPLCGAFLWPNLVERQSWLFIWQLYPTLLSIYLFAISKLFPETVDVDKYDAPKRDLPIIRLYMGLSIVLVSSVWIWSWATGPYSMMTIYWPTAIPKTTTNFVDFNRDFLRYDQVFAFGPGLLWLLYLFGDLKHAGMMTAGWARILLSGLVTIVVLGPGATLGIGWLWREQILAEKRHKTALTEESVGRLHGVFGKKTI